MKSVVACVVVAAIVGLSWTQFSLVALGSPGDGSTMLVRKSGQLSHLPFFASDTQMCGGRGGMVGFACEGGFAMAVAYGDQHIATLPHMGFVKTLSIALSGS